MTSTKPQRPPRKHHYLPECYQMPWAGPDGKVERYARGYDGSVVPKRLSPAGVGWRPNLYSIPGEVDVWAAARIETEFFAKIDSDAASIMRRMRETSAAPSTSEDRTAWAMFVFSFFHRTPEHLRATLTKLAELNDGLMPEAESRYSELRGPEDPPTFREWKRLRAEDALERSMLRTVTDLISSPKTGPYFINLHWDVLNVAASDHELVIGDNPVILVPLKQHAGHLALPIGPSHIFVASADRQFIRDLKRTPAKVIVRHVNRLMVERATDVVIASDGKQAPFIEKHFGSCKVGSLATGLSQPARPTS